MSIGTFSLREQQFQEVIRAHRITEKQYLDVGARLALRLGTRQPRPIEERVGRAAEVDHLDVRYSIRFLDKHVVRLNVPVDDSLLMGVLNRLARLRKET